jgi:hypothetical protein
MRFYMFSMSLLRTRTTLYCIAYIQAAQNRHSYDKVFDFKCVVLECENEEWNMDGSAWIDCARNVR